MGAVRLMSFISVVAAARVSRADDSVAMGEPEQVTVLKGERSALAELGAQMSEIGDQPMDRVKLWEETRLPQCVCRKWDKKRKCPSGDQRTHRIYLFDLTNGKITIKEHTFCCKIGPTVSGKYKYGRFVQYDGAGRSPVDPHKTPYKTSDLCSALWQPEPQLLYKAILPSTRIESYMDEEDLLTYRYLINEGYEVDPPAPKEREVSEAEILVRWGPNMAGASQESLEELQAAVRAAEARRSRSNGLVTGMLGMLRPKMMKYSVLNDDLNIEPHELSAKGAPKPKQVMPAGLLGTRLRGGFDAMPLAAAHAVPEVRATSVAPRPSTAMGRHGYVALGGDDDYDLGDDSVRIPRSFEATAVCMCEVRGAGGTSTKYIEGPTVPVDANDYQVVLGTPTYGVACQVHWYPQYPCICGASVVAIYSDGTRSSNAVTEVTRYNPRTEAWSNTALAK